jgi:exopolysaccharide biosynthesis polyprenyl glycosylphosphotransferase
MDRFCAEAGRKSRKFVARVVQPGLPERSNPGLTVSVQEISQPATKVVFPALNAVRPAIARTNAAARQAMRAPAITWPIAKVVNAFGLSAQRRHLTASRIMDVLIAGIVILLLSPFFFLIPLVIRMDSKGPVIFCQRRAGEGGKLFGIYKFRSMRVMEDGAQITQAVKGDARVTKVGAFLRASSLDELPQLFNVLAGDMSLVGPRPHALAHDEYYAMRISNYRVRHLVKPGITGWAQVNGLRGITNTVEDMKARINLDAWYVANKSLWLDLRILARTPFEVIRGRNAV